MREAWAQDTGIPQNTLSSKKAAQAIQEGDQDKPCDKFLPDPSFAQLPGSRSISKSTVLELRCRAGMLMYARSTPWRSIRTTALRVCSTTFEGNFQATYRPVIRLLCTSARTMRDSKDQWSCARPDWRRWPPTPHSTVWKAWWIVRRKPPFRSRAAVSRTPGHPVIGNSIQIAAATTSQHGAPYVIAVAMVLCGRAKDGRPVIFGRLV